MPQALYEQITQKFTDANIDRLVQERRNSNALAMELRLSYTNPSMCATRFNVSLHLSVLS